MPFKDAEVERDYRRKYYEKNRATLVVKAKAYVVSHREEIRQQQHQWYIKNRAKTLAKQNAYSAAHRSEAIERAKAWADANPERKCQLLKKQKTKRRGLFGFVPINPRFKGREGHHINNSDVINIPEELHRSIPHCLKTGRNMIQINALAIAWLTEDWT